MISKKVCIYYEKTWIADPTKHCDEIDCAKCPYNDGYLNNHLLTTVR